MVPRLRAIAAAGQLQPGTRVLDVGTGTGVLLPFFKEQGVDLADVVGVDVSPGMLEVARRRYPQAGFWEGDVADFRPAEGEELFDAVFFNAVFGNVFDQAAALGAVGAVTRRGARVVIRCVPCFYWGYYAIGWFILSLHAPTCGWTDKHTRARTHTDTPHCLVPTRP